MLSASQYYFGHGMTGTALTALPGEPSMIFELTASTTFNGVEKRYELLDETIDALSAFHFCM